MIYWNGKFDLFFFWVKNDIITLYNICKLYKLEKPMFLFLTFPLVDQIETCVAI